MEGTHKRISPSIKNSDPEDITGDIIRTRTHGEKWFNGRGASRQRWRAKTAVKRVER